MAFMFLDVETTGLDPKVDELLEIGMIWTDDFLTIYRTFHGIIKLEDINYTAATDVYEPPFGISLAVVEMHHKSRLWRDSYNEGKTLDAVTFELGEWLGSLECDFKKEEVYLAGNTVNFDMGFLREHIPGVIELFPYRSVDVSSVRILSDKWRPVHWDGGKKEHRVIPDILDSITQLKLYKEALFQ